MLRYNKESFEEMVFKEPNTGCWLTAGKSLYGPSKLSFKLFNGNIPDGQWVLHKCDTPACVNPIHLFLGDRRDNMIDAVQKKRQFNSSKTHCSKGHAYEGNSYFETQHGYLRRRCKTCQYEKLKRNRAKKRLIP